ncbi:MAG: type I DNA topoisomerase [Bacteroidota bacterium]
MTKNLVIVESPAKAKTIERFLGKDFSVRSCFGHIRDLHFKELSVDIKNNFIPTYIIPSDKKKTITELKKLSNEAELVWLATDEDREGEAISWHLVKVLELAEEKIKRIVFHEITKSAILNAIENPRGINKSLVDAQQARRVLDRLVGYEISPVLWKKVKPALSAGRVQSVAVRLIVEREREIQDFKMQSYYKVIGDFYVNKKDTVQAGSEASLGGGQENHVLQAELTKRFYSLEEARKFLQQCIGADFIVKDLEVKPGKKSPAPPFITSTLQQEASRKLGFSVAQTMRIAQKLYESGRITYMRTDSVNLSNSAIAAAKEVIAENYGTEYVNSKQYKTKIKGAQEAHEAIRPTYMHNQSINGDNNEKRLYDLIWKRMIASQMSDAEFEKTAITIDVSSALEDFIARGEVMKFDGFLKVYLESKDEEAPESHKGVLPPLTTGKNLLSDIITATERFTSHSLRYTEASLVKKLEELGIGRPSTYAPTISTIQKREYVVKEDKKGFERQYNVLTLKGNSINDEARTEIAGAEKSKLFPSDIGMVVNDFLIDHFNNIMDYNFTANVEKEFDEIARGKKVWNEMIKQFYNPFHASVKNSLEISEKATGERLLGVDTVSGRKVFVKIGRYGPMVQIGQSNEEEKPKFASLMKDQSITNISLDEALDLFKLPRSLGEFEEKELTIGIGKFGPYVKHDDKYYSLKQDDDPLSINKERSVEIIQLKRKADKEKIIRSFEENKEVKVLKGRWGPYISIGKENFKIPKNIDPTTLILEDCIKISKETKNVKSTWKSRKR